MSRFRLGPVGGQGVEGAGMQQDLSALAIFGLSDHQQPLVPVDVVAVEGHGLSDVHVGCRQQADEGLERRRPQTGT